MPGKSDIDSLLKHMKPVQHDGEFVFCTLSQEQAKHSHLDPVCRFQEDEGITLILPRTQAENVDLSYTYISRMITLSVNSNLHAVGFLAAVTSKLAEYDISVNAVSAFYHDHLFVPSCKSQ